MSSDILAVSRIGETVFPYLDDFAQIIGSDVLVADNDITAVGAKQIAQKLKKRNAVLLKDNGAFCTGPNKNDALASVMVMEKGCKTLLGVALFGKIKPIHPFECRLMRFVYQTQYSKKATSEGN